MHEFPPACFAPDPAVCAARDELLPGHEGEAGDAVLGPALAALHAALSAAALYVPDTNLASNYKMTQLKKN